MRRVLILAAVLASSAFLLPGPAAGQSRSQAREGFFVGLGLGWSSLGYSDRGGERESGASAYFKLGDVVSERLLLGFEMNGWYKDGEEVTLSQSIVAYFYPDPTSGFFLKVGAGSSIAEKTGYGLVAGLGYDARIRDMFSLTPVANLVLGSFDADRMSVFQAGLGLTWH